MPLVTREQLEQLTSWARRLRVESDVAEARAAARAVLLLADGDGLSDDQVGEMTAFARRLRTESDVPDARAAARAILLLAEDREASTNGSDGQIPPAPSAAQALMERLRRGPPADGNGAEAEVPRTLGDVLRERAVARRPARPSAPPVQPTEAAAAAPSPDLEGQPPALDAAQAEIRDHRQARTLEAERRRRRARVRLVVLLGGVVVLLGGAYEAATRVSAPDLEPQGPADPLVGARELAGLTFAVRADEGDLERVRWELDGRNVTGSAVRTDDGLVLRPRGLRDGRHAITVRASGPLPGSDAGETWHILVDARPPAMRFSGTSVPKGSPLRLVGRTEPEARVRLAGRALAVDDDGRFTIARASVPAGRSGWSPRTRTGTRRRATSACSSSRAARPRRARRARDLVRVGRRRRCATACSTSSTQGRIDAVELDLKDESGMIGFDADVPLGERMGAVQKVYDLRAPCESCTRAACWSSGASSPSATRSTPRRPGTPAGATRSCRRRTAAPTRATAASPTSPARPCAATTSRSRGPPRGRGIDDILYDYVRRPDGPTSTMRFPGLRGRRSASIIGFLRRARASAPPYDVFLGASVFGVAATRPTRWRRTSRRWRATSTTSRPWSTRRTGGRASTTSRTRTPQPYAIVRRSLADFKRQMRGTGARVVPWLQDFSLGVDYGPAEVRAQIKAARDVGIASGCSGTRTSRTPPARSTATTGCRREGRRP